jgi:hypothetical protein
MAAEGQGTDATPQDKPSDNALLTLARDNLGLLVPIRRELARPP